MDIFNMLYSFHPFLAHASRLYMFLLLFFFTWTCLNIFLLIIVSSIQENIHF